MSTKVSTTRRQLLLGKSQQSTQQVSPHAVVPVTMRSPDNPSVDDVNNRDVIQPPLSAITYARAAFGHRPGDLNAFNELGVDDGARLTAWVNQQLDPDSIDDSACDDRIANAVFTTHEKTALALWSEHWRNPNWHIVIRPGIEAITLKFVRAMHSRRQLKEVMVDFWHNHFSVFWQESPGQSMLMHYDRDVIRPNSLGNFRTFLKAVAKSPSMMFYLDQVYSTADGPNENYARELLELHTFGSDHYYGIIPSAQVPGYPSPEGYVEEDVFALTKALTGWSIRYFSWNAALGDTGEFFTNDAWHNNEQKTLLGQSIAAGQTALAEGEQVLDLLATHQCTATFIAKKLCTRFVSDLPPESLVQSAAGVFLSATDADDQIAQVMRHILLSAEFSSTWGMKTKRPFDALISALRAGASDLTLQTTQENDSTSDTLHWLYGFTGHYPHEWHPPNGYPDFGPVWLSSSSLVMRWRLLNWLVDTKMADNNWLIEIIDNTANSDARSPDEIVDFWIERLFGYAISTTTRDHFVRFLAQGRNPELNMPLEYPLPPASDYAAHRLWDRIRALVGLMISSPEFQMK